MGNSVVCHLCSSLSHLSFICTFVTIYNLVFYDSSADMHFFIETKKKTTEYKEYILSSSAQKCPQYQFLFGSADFLYCMCVLLLADTTIFIYLSFASSACLVDRWRQRRQKERIDICFDAEHQFAKVSSSIFLYLPLPPSTFSSLSSVLCLPSFLF